MTVGELLKEYRIKQNKNQQEFSAGIVSQIIQKLKRIFIELLLMIYCCY